MTDLRSKQAGLDLPQLLPFLPMLYVAWADSELTSEEMVQIYHTLTGTQGLERECLDALGSWLNPEAPPNPLELLRLLNTVRHAAGELDEVERRSLSELGLALARAGRVEPREPERQALAAIEGALGLTGQRISRSLLVAQRPAAPEVSAEVAFDVAALTRLLDGEQRVVREELRALLSQGEFAYRYGLDSSTYREAALNWTRELAARGYGCLSYPKTVGGAGDLGAALAAFETLAHHDLSLLVKFGVQFGLFGGSILQLGTGKHHRRYLREVGSLELPGCFAMSETGHGSNVHDLETTAHYDPDTQELIIHTPRDEARKDYIGNAALHGRLATVFAQLEVGGHLHGVHAILVPIRHENGTPCSGVRIEDCGEKLGLNGVDNGRLWFDHVRVPRANLLDRFAELSEDGAYSSPIASPSKRFFTMLGTLVGGRVSVGLASVSAAKSAIAIAVRYATRRRQFGPGGEPEVLLLDYLTHQRRLLPRLAATYALHFALRDLARRYIESTEEDRREVEGLAAGLKAMASWHAVDTIQTCREACGGAGYLAVNRFAALRADTDVFTTFEGDNTVLMQLVAKGMLTGYRRQFGEMTLLGMARYLGSRGVAAVTQLNPVLTRLTSEDHLRGRDFQLGALRWREERLLASLGRRIKGRLDRDTDATLALIECQDHLVSTAKAHVERVVLEAFAARIEGSADPDLSRILDSLCSLFALSRIEADRGWFLEQGYLEGTKTEAIRKLVNKLCGELRKQAVPLVDAFGIPPALLGAPIAK